MCHRIACCWLIALSAAVPTAQAADPVTVVLARDGTATAPVVVGPDASPAVKETAGELARYLGRISGGTFTVEPGTGRAGLVVGRPGDFAELPFVVAFGTGPLDREDYVIRSRAGGLYLLGATDLAVSHAAWDLLHRLGYRQYFPGETWEIVPSTPDLAIAIDERQRPSFHARRIWYNWGLWGYNADPYRDWCRRNRMAKGLDLNSGHAYESIVAANKAAFDRHPEYFALLDGQREPRPNAKFCIANPGLRTLIADHAARVFRANPTADSLSMDPSDGGGWCECPDCARLGSVSTRVAMLANIAAESANGLDLGPKYVGLYAYNQHAAPPAIKVHPNVIPSATTAFIGGGLSYDEVVRGWQAQGATMGTYDYLSVVAWDWNLPRGGAGSRLAHITGLLPRIHGMGVRFYDAEAGDCWGPCGLGYYLASRVLWDINQAETSTAIVDDFLAKSFGDAEKPMREFYRLTTEDTQRRPPSDLVGRMYRQLAAARAATADPKVHARIDALTLFTRHAELYHAKANGTGSVEAVARHAYKMRTTMMVHSYGLWSRLVSQNAALDPKHPWKDKMPYTAAEVAAILSAGIAANEPVDPGFAGVEYSTKLVPAAGPLGLPDVPAGSFPTVPQDMQRYYVWLPEKAKSLDLKVTVTKVWENRQPEVRLYSPREVTLDPVAVDQSYKPDGKTSDVRLKTPYAGLHRVEFVDGGDYTRVAWPKGIPVTVPSGIDTPGVTSQFRGSWTLYFYVPKGTKVIGGWSARVANWAPRASGTLVAPDGRKAFDFGTADEGWFKVPVPDGQDGKLWKFENSLGQRLLMTVPPYLARSAGELLLPAEVIAANGKK